MAVMFSVSCATTKQEVIKYDLETDTHMKVEKTLIEKLKDRVGDGLLIYQVYSAFNENF